jgi:hypothetical protein
MAVAMIVSIDPKTALISACEIDEPIGGRRPKAERDPCARAGRIADLKGIWLSGAHMPLPSHRLTLAHIADVGAAVPDPAR